MSLIPSLAPSWVYPLCLHDALPIWVVGSPGSEMADGPATRPARPRPAQSRSSPSRCSVMRMSSICSAVSGWLRSEEHTSELQSRGHLVCRHLLENKKRYNVECFQ